MSDAALDKVAAPGRHGAEVNSLTRRDLLVSITLLIAALLLWELIPRLFAVRSFIFPSFSDTMVELFFLVENDHLIFHTLITAMNVLIGFVLGGLFGAVVGYMLGLCRPAEVILSPYLLLLQIAPKVAFAPLFIMWFGYNVFPKILVTILIVFFPVAINVLSAMRGIDPDQLRLARSMNATSRQVFWKIQFRASLPELLAGMRIGSTLAVIGVVVGEMVGGNTGLGYLLVFGQGQANTATVFVTIIMLTLIGIIAYFAVLLVEQRVLRWRPAETH